MLHSLRNSLARIAPQLIGLGLPLVIAALATWQWRRAYGYIAADLVNRPYPHRGPGPIDEWLPVLAPVTLILALLALALYLLAALALVRAARRALRSRDDLLHGFDRARRWLPGFLLLQSVLILLALVGMLGFELLHQIDIGSQTRARDKLIGAMALCSLALIVLVGAIVFDMLRFALHRPPPDPIVIMGRQLSPTQAPALWDYVRAVAAKAGGSAPDSIVVGLNEGFFVTEYPVQLANGEPVPPGRVLYLPLPYMAFMDRDQVTSVIAHEMGHFIGDDTVYSTRFSPIYRTASGAIQAITRHDEDDSGWRELLTMPAALFGQWFLSRFDEAVKHWSRLRELEADGFSRRVTSAQTAALTLLRVTALAPLVDHVLAQNLAAPGQREGVVPMVRRLAAEHGLVDPRDHLDDRQAHPLDTHPPLGQRLEALGITPSPETIQASRDPRPSDLLVQLGLESAPPVPA